MEPYAVLDAIRAHRGGRIAFKSALVLAVATLSAGFFGLCVPFFLLSMQILPGLGVAGVLYVFGGGLGGLLFGAVSSGVSLSRTDRLVTRYYAILFATLAILSLGYLVAYLNIEALQRHV
ncbi:MAG: hypothetical protein IPJ34_26765 [Myxococcales bacterium]|nr:hypothetical protein [Myxococcales bacterium]